MSSNKSTLILRSLKEKPTKNCTMESDQEKIDVLLGQYLLSIRLSKGVSQQYLAELLGKGQSDVAKIEKGRKKLTVADFLKWHSALSCPLINSMDQLQMAMSIFPTNKTLWKPNDE